RSVFEAFDEYLASVANVDIARLILSKPFAPVNQPPSVRAAARRMRAHMADWIAAHRADGTSGDIAADIMAARDPETGEGFDEETLIDQIGVFFLAGHETTANALTWAFHILSEQPDVANAIRTEVNAVAGDGPVTLDVVKQLPYTRAVLKETMRLYPPLPFLPRVAMKDTAIGSMAVKRGAMIMIAPWTIHRYRVLWPLADRFDPGRFSPDNEKDIPNGAYIPFGLGPRICVGSGFALVEGTLALARLVRRFTLTSADAQSVRPVARLAIRPHAPILTTVTDDG
ncbi:MAG: cytochrome P450, partial [Pseudomonadota bacterium]